jgi:hypothetical protein
MQSYLEELQDLKEEITVITSGLNALPYPTGM